MGNTWHTQLQATRSLAAETSYLSPRKHLQIDKKKTSIWFILVQLSNAPPTDNLEHVTFSY